MKRLHHEWYRPLGAWPQRAALTFAAWLLVAFVPSDVRVETSDRALSFASGANVISAATLCPGYNFVQFGPSGPTFSPDLHYVLVDVLGPFEPGDVGRTHALISVESGAIVRALDWPHYFAIRASAKNVSWASGQRQSLRYDDGKTESIPETPLHPLPANLCRS